MKKIISIILVFAMILSLSSMAFAAEENTDYIIDTDNKIVQILTGDGWSYIADNISTYRAYTIEILSDITVNKSLSDFRGSLIGKLNGVSGEKPTLTINNLSNGLIATYTKNTAETYIKDIIIDGTVTDTSGSANIGALISTLKALSYPLHIENVTNECSVSLLTTSKKAASGFVAFVTYNDGADDQIYIENCVNKGTITSARQAGGFIGNTSATETSNDIIQIKNCNNFGVVKGNNANYSVGGFVGLLGETAGTVEIEGCKNYGNIGNATLNVGGIIGQSDIVTGNLTIKKCANYGNITGNGSNTGGIVGTAKNINLSESFNAGNITADKYAAGLIAISTGKIISITDSYNAGTVNGISGYSMGLFGILGGTYASKTFTATAESLTIKNLYSIGNILYNGQVDTTSTGLTCIYGLYAGVINGNTYDISGLYRISNTSLPVYRSHIYAYDTDGSSDDLEKLKGADFEELSDYHSEMLPGDLSATKWISLQNNYPVLRNNLPTNSNGTPVTYHIVTLENGENGTAYKDEETLVKDGDVYTLTVKADDGYQVDMVENLTEVEGIYQTTAVTGPVTVSVTYKELPSEGVTGATDAFYSDAFEFEGQQVDSYNIVHFARFTVKDGVDAIYGIEISEDNFTSVLKDGRADSDYNGQYGVRFFGAKIVKGNTYYLRPYVSYDDGATYTYGDIITYQTLIEN